MNFHVPAFCWDIFCYFVNYCQNMDFFNCKKFVNERKCALLDGKKGCKTVTKWL